MRLRNSIIISNFPAQKNKEKGKGRVISDDLYALYSNSEDDLPSVLVFSHPLVRLSSLLKRSSAVHRNSEGAICKVWQSLLCEL